MGISSSEFLLNLKSSRVTGKSLIFVLVLGASVQFIAFVLFCEIGGVCTGPDNAYTALPLLVVVLWYTYHCGFQFRYLIVGGITAKGSIIFLFALIALMGVGDIVGERHYGTDILYRDWFFLVDQVVMRVAGSIQEEFFLGWSYLVTSSRNLI